MMSLLLAALSVTISVSGVRVLLLLLSIISVVM